jgi:hypothetical protein
MNRMELIEALKDAEVYHHSDEDMYGCGLSKGDKCTCGADDANKAIKAAIEYLECSPIGEVKRLSLKPNDVIIVKSSRMLTMSQRQEIMASTQQVFAGHKVIVLQAPLDIEVAGEPA